MWKDNLVILATILLAISAVFMSLSQFHSSNASESIQRQTLSYQLAGLLSDSVILEELTRLKSCEYARHPSADQKEFLKICLNQTASSDNIAFLVNRSESLKQELNESFAEISSSKQESTDNFFFSFITFIGACIALLIASLLTTKKD